MVTPAVPESTEPPPPGHRWELRPSPSWHAETGEGGMYPCRANAGPGHAGCRADSVAYVVRTHGDNRRRWYYCAEHLYDNVIRDGHVWRWIAVPLEEPDPADGPPSPRDERDVDPPPSEGRPLVEPAVDPCST